MVGAGVAVGFGVGVAVAVGSGIGVAVGSGIGVGVGSGLGVGVGVGVSSVAVIAVGTGDGVGVAVGTGVGVGVGVSSGMAVTFGVIVVSSARPSSSLLLVQKSESLAFRIAGTTNNKSDAMRATMTIASRAQRPPPFFPPLPSGLTKRMLPSSSSSSS